MRGQDNCLVLFELLHEFPNCFAAYWVHARRWLIEKDDFRVADGANGNRKTSLHAT